MIRATRLERAAVVALFVAASPAGAQELTGWLTVYSSAEYDYMVSVDNVIMDADTAGAPRSARMFVGQMLVRHADDARRDLIAKLRADNLPWSEYGRYASSTHVVEVRCLARVVRRSRITDFDTSGGVLGEREMVPEWSPPGAYPDSAAIDALVDWLCSQPGAW